MAGSLPGFAVVSAGASAFGAGAGAGALWDVLAQ